MTAVFEADEVQFSYGPLNVLNGLTLSVSGRRTSASSAQTASARQP